MAYNPFNEVQRLKKQVSYLYKKITCFIDDCCIKNTSELINDGENGVNPFITESDSFDRIINGNVFWVENLDFSSTPILYRLNGQEYIAPVTNLTLSPADSLLPRIDLFAVNNNSELIIIEGVPNINPQEPTLQFGSQLRVTTVLIPAGSNTPDGFSDEIVYAENTEEPDEWNNEFVSFTDSASTTPEVIFDSLSPDTGVLNITATNIPPNSSIRFTNNEKTLLINLSSLNFRFKTNLSFIYQCNIYLYNDNTPVKSITVNNNEYGFDSITLNNYNTVSIPLSAFVTINASEVEFDTIYLSFNQVTGNTRPLLLNPSFDIDNIRLLFGGEIINNDLSFIQLSDTPDDYINEAGKFPQVNQNEDGLEFVELPDSPDSSDVIKLKVTDLLSGTTLEDQVVNTINSMNYNKEENISSLSIEIIDPKLVVFQDLIHENTGNLQYLGFGMSSDGLKLFVHRFNRTSQILTLSEAFNPSTVNNIEDLSVWSRGGWWIQDDGLRFAITSGNSIIRIFEGTTAYDFNNFTETSNFNLPGTDNREIHFNDNGLEYYVSISISEIQKYVLTTPFDVTTSVLNSTLVTPFNTNNNMTFSKDLKTIIRYSGNQIWKIILNNAGDFSNFSIETVTLSNNPLPNGNFLRVKLSNNGRFLLGSAYSTPDYIFKYQLTEPFEIGSLKIV